MARSTTFQSMFATWCLAKLTSCRNGWSCSILYAACSTISLAAYSSIAESAIIHWIACFSASGAPCRAQSGLPGPVPGAGGGEDRRVRHAQVRDADLTVVDMAGHRVDVAHDL